MNGSILVVDDERSQREILATILAGAGYQVSTASDGRGALQLLAEQEFDIILTDLKMQGMGGMELLARILENDPDQCVIIMTAHGSVDSAVAAMKQGAFDYLEKPLDHDSLFLTIRRAVDHSRLLRENRILHRRLSQDAAIPEMIGDHPSIWDVYRIVARIAPTSSTVLIQGESGTGKELVARAIHRGSRRHDKPFMAINCAAIPDSLMESELFGHEKGAFTGATQREIGLFEAASGGTVFLDEIGEMSVSMQAKLLRAIQEKEIRRVGGKVTIPVDLRIVAATNRDLEQEIKNGTFREDLFYRLNVIRIDLPPLRERGNDIALLATHFLRKHVATHSLSVKGFSPRAMKLLMEYHWPGNVRQLESLVERSVLMAEGELIEPADLPAEITRSTTTGAIPIDLPPEGIHFEDLERTLILKAMERSDWVIARAAPLLGMSYKTLQYRLEKFGIRRPEG
ncbi:MAG: sigma-54 dependent transcriptional regulator [Desulfuromonadia bacterium]